jgi:Rab guanine nucleotide exchange factor SEC2
METAEQPKTPEPTAETEIDSSGHVPEVPAPTGDPKPGPATPTRNPVRVVPFGGTDTPKKDGSRPTTPGARTGTPPPVPRRAAARGTPRPGSALITPDILKPPPPRSERRVVGKVVGEGKGKKVEGKIVDEKIETKVEAPVVTKEVIGIAPVAAVESKGQSTGTPQVEAEVPTPAPEGEPVAVDTATPNTPINAPSSLSEPTPEPTAETPSMVTTTETTPADRASILSVSSASVYTKDTKDTLPPIPATTATDGDTLDDEWVGNTRWEDRAWIEIVRIREEMFWARVGSGIVGGADTD